MRGASRLARCRPGLPRRTDPRQSRRDQPRDRLRGHPPEQADPDALLALWRDHRLIENRPHWRRDVTLREDHSSIRSGTSPRAMAALRNTMLAIGHDLAEPLTEIREIFAEDRLEAIAAARPGFL